MKRWLKYSLLGLLGIILFVFFSRLILPSQIDDVTPGISCEEKLLRWADVFYVIPNFEGYDISNDESWCNKIFGMNKELAIHGVFHTYEEFGVYLDEVYVLNGVDLYEKCFGETPERFKPPQLKWTKANNWMKDDFEVDLFWNQLFHKVYHCDDTGLFPNWFVRVV